MTLTACDTREEDCAALREALDPVLKASGPLPPLGEDLSAVKSAAESITAASAQGAVAVRALTPGSEAVQQHAASYATLLEARAALYGRISGVVIESEAVKADQTALLSEIQQAMGTVQTTCAQRDNPADCQKLFAVMQTMPANPEAIDEMRTFVASMESAKVGEETLDAIIDSLVTLMGKQLSIQERILTLVTTFEEVTAQMQASDSEEAALVEQLNATCDG